jgi:hypothetical protein
MAERAGKDAIRHPFRERLTIKVGGAYIPPPTVRCRSARWRTCEAHHRTVVSRLALAGRERLRSFPVFRKAALAVLPPGVCCLKLWIGRKRNVGGGVLADFSSAGASLCWKGRRETSAVLRFDSSSFVRSRPAQAVRDRRAWDSSNVVIEPIRISNLRV